VHDCMQFLTYSCVARCSLLCSLPSTSLLCHQNTLLLKLSLKYINLWGNKYTQKTKEKKSDAKKNAFVMQKKIFFYCTHTLSSPQCIVCTNCCAMQFLSNGTFLCTIQNFRAVNRTWSFCKLVLHNI